MAKTKVLFVEHDRVMRDLCQLFLGNQGFDPIVASNGIEGFEVYQQRHEEIGLVIADVTMSVRSGIDLVRKIFEIDSRSKVILMSGYGLSDLVPDEIRRLCSAIQKPFTPEELLTAVKKCLENDKESHAPPA